MIKMILIHIITKWEKAHYKQRNKEKSNNRFLAENDTFQNTVKNYL